MSTDKLEFRRVQTKRWKGRWEDVELPEFNPGRMILRDWQALFLDEALGSDRPHILLNAFMGSGKGLAMRAALGKQLEAEPRKRAIIAVPALPIAFDFSDAQIIEYPDGTQFSWAAYNNFARGKADTTEGLRKFLENRVATDILDRTAICTHQTLVKLFDESPELFRNLIIVLDEAHHSQVDGEKGSSNRIGEIVKFGISNSGKKKINLWLATATPFRGDQLAIIPEKDEKRFYRFEFPFDEHLRNLVHLKSFNYDFLVYQVNYADLLRDMFREFGIKRTLVQIPQTGSNASVSKKDKKEDYEAVVRAIADSDEPQRRPHPDYRGAEQVWSETAQKWIAVVNLINERERDITTVQALHNSDVPDDDFVVVAMKLMKEGANLRHLNRIVILGARYSLTDLVQTIGRGFRDAPDKIHLDIIHFLPDLLRGSDEQREQSDALLTMVINAMMMQLYLSPKLDDWNPDDLDKERSNSGSRRDILQEVFPNQDDLHDFFHACINIALQHRLCYEDVDQEFAEKTFIQEVEEYLAEFGTEEHLWEDVTKSVLRRFKHQSIQSQSSLNLENADWVEEVGAFDFIPSLLTSRDRTVKDLDAIREAECGRLYEAFGEWKTVREWSEDARCTTAESTLCNLLWQEKHPMNIEHLLQRGKPNRGRKFTAFGEWKLLADWEVDPRVSISKGAFRGRVQMAGYPDDIEECITADYRDFLSLDEFRAFLMLHGVTLEKEYINLRSSLPNSGLPSKAARAYSLSWREIVGGVDIIPFVEARIAVRQLGVQSQREYQERYKEIPGLPSNPNVAYGEHGWVGMEDFLGIDNGILVEEFGESKMISEWARDSRCRVKEATLRARIKKGWSPGDAITTPVEDVNEYEAYGELKTFYQWIADERSRTTKSTLFRAMKREGVMPGDSIEHLLGGRQRSTKKDVK